MRKIIALYTMLVGAIFLTSLVAVPVASAVDAEEYTADEGWGVGQTITLNWTWNDMPDGTKNMVSLLLAESGLDVDELGLNLDAAFYAYVTVDEVKAEEYVMSAKMAIKLAAKGNIDAFGDMPKANNYNISIAEVFKNNNPSDTKNMDYEAIGIETENKSVTLDLGIEFALIIGGTIVMEKETLAIKSMDLSLKAAAVISFDARNIPDIESDSIYSEGPIPIPANFLLNVSYNNYDVDLKASIDANMNIVFEPALNIYDLPIAEGEKWTIDSKATINGGMKGFVDITGLPEDVEKKLFDEEGVLYKAGFTKFPLVFDEFKSGDLVIKDGKLEELVTDIKADVTVTDTKTVNDRAVFTLKADYDGEEVEYIYSSELIDVFVSATMFDMGEGMPDIKDLEALGIEFNNEEVTADDAAAEIKSIENYHATVDKKAKGESDFPLMAVLAVVVVAVVIAGAAVVFVRRKK